MKWLTFKASNVSSPKLHKFEQRNSSIWILSLSIWNWYVLYFMSFKRKNNLQELDSSIKCLIRAIESNGKILSRAKWDTYPGNPHTKGDSMEVGVYNFNAKIPGVVNQPMLYEKCSCTIKSLKAIEGRKYYMWTKSLDVTQFEIIPAVHRALVESNILFLFPIIFYMKWYYYNRKYQLKILVICKFTTNPY